ncbi:hypothetical protein C8J56DRAFT_886202 [Mycena floridula]|nr:hypothetical protein C8J56DRAFT_886202 [Mycena floridula]
MTLPISSRPSKVWFIRHAFTILNEFQCTLYPCITVGATDGEGVENWWGLGHIEVQRVAAETKVAEQKLLTVDAVEGNSSDPTMLNNGVEVKAPPTIAADTKPHPKPRPAVSTVAQDKKDFQSTKASFLQEHSKGYKTAVKNDDLCVFIRTLMPFYLAEFPSSRPDALDEDQHEYYLLSAGVTKDNIVAAASKFKWEMNILPVFLPASLSSATREKTMGRKSTSSCNYLTLAWVYAHNWFALFMELARGLAIPSKEPLTWWQPKETQYLSHFLLQQTYLFPPALRM